MARPLTVLVITSNIPPRKRVKFENRAHQLFPQGTKIDYATYGTAREEQGTRQAELEKYDIVMMPGSMADHFNTCAAIYHSGEGSAEPDRETHYTELLRRRPRPLIEGAPHDSVPIRMRYDPKLRKLP